jgi:thiol-disulfide isomerase/thioredoxin
MCGCSQTGGLRPATPDNIKTTASVGDKAMPVVAGAPGDSVRADTADPELPRTSRGRISGRVYDDEGNPAANAMVRLAVGGDPGGRAVFAKTDRSGAFTLNGLRPGSSYTVIAEYQGEQGMMSGRADADAPETGVRIGLHLRDARRSTSGVGVAAARPDRSKARPISRIEPAEDEGPQDEPSIVNREDLPAPAADADVSRSRAEARRARPSDAVALDPDLELDREEPVRTWSSGSRSSGKPSTTKAAEPSFEESAEAEDFNPLPPAREVGDVGDRPERPPARTADRSRARRRAAPVDEPPAAEAEVFASDGEERAEPDPAGDAPRPLPDEFGKGGRPSRSEQFAPLVLDEPEETSARSAPPERPRPRPRPVDDAEEPAVEEPQAVRAKRPTWSELSLHSASIPLDEAIERTSAGGASTLARTAEQTTRLRPVEASAGRLAPRAGAGLASSPPNGRSLAPSLLPGRTSGPFCDFDDSEQRLNDFALPDVSGRLVSFRDIDADLILLDFWGTWCGQCRTSIPHLKELQSTLGGKRLQVVGIACEQKPAGERAGAVAQVVEKLGINYTVLVTGMDGNCKVQDAFRIRFYPTMVLLDRDGRILSRQEGATTTTLTKIDNQIAKSLDREPRAVAARRRPADRR